MTRKEIMNALESGLIARISLMNAAMATGDDALANRLQAKAEAIARVHARVAKGELIVPAES